MNIGSVNTASRVALIAEVGNNHEGSASRAEELIEAAFAAGADAVKLQTFVPELFVSREQTERLEMLNRFSLPDEQLQLLLRKYGSRGLVVFSTPLDLVSLEQLSAAPLIKISSGDITFAQLIEATAQSRKDMILSTGASTLTEVRKAVDLVRSTWTREGHQGDLAVLHCVSAYPAPPHSLNLRAIQTIKEALPEVSVGYSDHSLGIDAAIAAVAVGARIIEKHFTLDRNQSHYRDHQLSADPLELALLRERIDELECMLGPGDKRPSDAEEEMRTQIRRSVSVCRDLPVGHRLTNDDLCMVRPGNGLAPTQVDEVIGCTLRRSVSAGEILMHSDIA